jgi:hypothetical protein
MHVGRQKGQQGRRERGGRESEREKEREIEKCM